MFFGILMWFVISAFVLWAVFSASGFFLMRDKIEAAQLALLSFVFLCFITVAPGGTLIGSWASHADDLSKVEAQDEVIRVHEERVESLSERLSGFDYPSGALMDADTPVGSIVSALSEAESSLARAREERAVAIRSIEARRRGPLSGVIQFVGDYEKQ